MEEKIKLRSQLFDHLFEVEEGILLPEFMEKISSKLQAYQELHELCLQNLESYDKFDSMKSVKFIFHNGLPYIFFKVHMRYFLVIDVKKEKVLDRNEVFQIFDESFFIQHLEESKSKYNWQEEYCFLNYSGNIKELLNFYRAKSYLLTGSNEVFYKVAEGVAWSSLQINLNTGDIKLSFRTEDQYLYEIIRINPDITLSTMQDVLDRMDKETLIEMVSRLHSLKLPESVIPRDVEQLVQLESKITSLKLKR